MALLSAVVSWSLRNRAVVLVATLVFLALGIHAALTLPIDAVPDVTSTQVQIITSAPALSPVEVEQYVTTPVERTMAGIPHTTEIRSISKYGISVVTVVFDDDTNVYFARQLVSERMQEALDAVPSQYGRPEMGPITTGLGEIYQFTVSNPHMTTMQLEELLDWQIAPLLRMVPGIVEVNAFGGEDRQYQVILEPARLQAAGVSISQVAEALRKSNENAGGGYIEHDREHFVIGTDGLVKDLEDLRNVVIGATPEGIPITIATVGGVRFGPRLRHGAASMDGEGEVVVGVAMMLMGANSMAVTQAVKDRVREILPSLPAGTRIDAFYDRSKLVDRTIGTVARNLIEGALLVIVVLLLLLGDLRAGIVVATTIPLSLLFAIVVMKAMGLSGNLMSLGAVDFGLIVDGAVIVVENAVRRLATARTEAGGGALSSAARLEVVRDATLEVYSASVFGVAIIAIVYLPVLALTGIEGKLFRPMAETVVLALAGAFMLSLTLVPVLTSLWVDPKAGHRETWLLRRIHAVFRPALGGAFRRRWVVLAAALLGLAGGALLFTRLGAEFVPQLDEGDVLVEARRLPGVALSESVDTDRRMQRAILHMPEVLHVVSKTGAPELATDPMGIEQTDVYIALQDRASWRPGLTKQDLAEQIAAELARSVPEVAISISQPIEMRTNELIAGVRSDVAILVYGRDLDELARLGNEAAGLVRGIPGATDVRVEQVAGLQYLRITPDRARLARYGLTVEDVNEVAAALAVGLGAGHVLEGDRRFGIALKVHHGFDGDLDTLRALPLRSISGQIVPLGDVATLGFQTGPAEVGREAQSRRITVELNVRGRDLMSVVKDAQAGVAKLALPPGYHIEWGGQFHHYREAKARLSLVVPLALALILFLLWLAFHHVRSALVIFLGVPFAVIGGVAALFVRGIPFSISAGIGFIALFGVAVLNGLVLVSFARQEQERGIEPATAIRRAAEVRLRPVLMTALVASLGFLPMALSTAPGSEVQRPLATVVIGGLFTAALLTLFVLPVVYAAIAGRSRS